MKDYELWAFIDAGNSVSMTNCGWDEYAIAKTYLESAQWLMRDRIASAIEAATAGETVQQGSTEGESAVPQADAQPPSGDS
jgi:hypothetical protein